MRVSTAWLAEWVRTGWDTDTLAQRLTMAGFEVEAIERAAAPFQGVVVARVLERRGRLFHYTGTPNKLTSGRDVPNEVAKRLKVAGFTTEMNGDGVLGVRR